MARKNTILKYFEKYEDVFTTELSVPAKKKGYFSLFVLPNLFNFILKFNNFFNFVVSLAPVWPHSLISKALHSCGRMWLFLVHVFTSSPSSNLVKEYNLMILQIYFCAPSLVALVGKNLKNKKQTITFNFMLKFCRS